MVAIKIAKLYISIDLKYTYHNVEGSWVAQLGQHCTWCVCGQSSTSRHDNSFDRCPIRPSSSVGCLSPRLLLTPENIGCHLSVQPIFYDYKSLDYSCLNRRESTHGWSTRLPWEPTKKLNCKKTACIHFKKHYNKVEQVSILCGTASKKISYYKYK